MHLVNDGALEVSEGALAVHHHCNTHYALLILVTKRHHPTMTGISVDVFLSSLEYE